MTNSPTRTQPTATVLALLFPATTSGFTVQLTAVTLGATDTVAFRVSPDESHKVPAGMEIEVFPQLDLTFEGLHSRLPDFGKITPIWPSGATAETPPMAWDVTLHVTFDTTTTPVRITWTQLRFMSYVASQKDLTVQGPWSFEFTPDQVAGIADGSPPTRPFTD